MMNKPIIENSPRSSEEFAEINHHPLGRFALMNSFLDVLVGTVAECRAALDATA